MALIDKYKELIDTATTAGTEDLSVRELEGVLYIDGKANAGTKQKLWDLYEKLDPDYTSGDLIMNINSVSGILEGAKLKVTTNRSNLNIRKGAGTDKDIIGKATRGEIVTLVTKENDQWWIIKTDEGKEGYCYTQYLTPVEG